MRLDFDPAIRERMITSCIIPETSVRPEGFERSDGACRRYVLAQFVESYFRVGPLKM